MIFGFRRWNGGIGKSLRVLVTLEEMGNQGLDRHEADALPSKRATKMKWQEERGKLEFKVTRKTERGTPLEHL